MRRQTVDCHVHSTIDASSTKTFGVGGRWYMVNVANTLDSRELIPQGGGWVDP